MIYKTARRDTIIRTRVAPAYRDAGSPRSVTRAAGRDAAKRNFILQLGFRDPEPADLQRRYSALTFQPKIVMASIGVGILSQSWVVFTVLGALLWWSALFPRLNPFRALYNYTIGSRPGALALDPAPTLRRAAETEAGGMALLAATLIHAGAMLAAYIVEWTFLAASLAVTLASFCTGSFIYHLLRGQWRFAFQTLPWVKEY